MGIISRFGGFPLFTHRRLVFVQSDSRIGFDKVEVDLVTEQLSNVVHAIPVTGQSDGHARSHWTHLIMVGRSKLRPQP